MSGYSFHVKKHTAKGQLENEQITNEVAENSKVQPAKTKEINSEVETIINVEKSVENTSSSVILSSNIQLDNAKKIKNNSLVKLSNNQILTEKKSEKDNVVIRKATRALIKKSVSPRRSNVDLTSDQILAIILSVIFPPLGVFFYTEFDFKKTLIALILTVLVYVPGLVYALLVIFDKI